MPIRAGRNRRGGVTGRNARERNRARVRDSRVLEEQANFHSTGDSLCGYTDEMVQAGKEFDLEVKKISMESCRNCEQRFLGLPLKRNLCCICQADPVMLSEDNHMKLGDVPPELSCLTAVEKMLIAQIHPVVSIYRLKGAQFAYKGNVISFVQNIQEYTTVLPCLPSQLSSVILFTRTTPTGVAEFKARSGKIRAALQWLKQHNDYYRNITISEENLSQLPTDGDVSAQFRSFQVSPIDDTPGPSESFVPFIESVDQGRLFADKLNLPYPTTEPFPVNEYQTEGFFTRAFPCLYPYGVGDFGYPRSKALTIDQYFNFCMNYPDRRFVHEPRFCYFAMNLKLRRQAVSCGALFARKSANVPLRTAADLKNRISSDPNYLKQMMVHAAKLRSTKPYWRQRCSELLSMVEQLGTPTVFFTLSAADYHWEDLFRLLRPGVDPKELSESNRRDLMHKNPDLVAYFFKKRCELFIQHVLKPIFKVKDHWFRYEWQWRGSPHLHGLLWLEDSPCVDARSFTPEELESMKVKFNGLCFAMNPHIHPDPPVSHPCRKTFSEVPECDRLSDLDQLLNMVQRHDCSDKCLRRKDGQLECRFRFPIEIREQSELSFVDGKLEYSPKRNDLFLGRYNPFITQVWRANTDFSVVTSRVAVINYIAKYASKAEKSSNFFTEVLDSVISNAQDDLEFKTLISKLFISTLSDRDYSAQEVIHVLKGWDMFGSSRDFVSLWVKEEDEWAHIQVEQDVVKESKSLISKYKDRPLSARYESTSLLQFARRHYVSNVQGQPVYRERRKEAVVRVFPLLRLSGIPETDEEYFRLQVVLNIPFRGSFEGLLHDPVTNVIHPTWRSRFDSLGIEITEVTDLRVQEDEGEQPETLNEQDQRDPYMAAAGMTNHVRTEEPLGRRLQDESHEWQCVNDYPSLSEARLFLKSLRESSMEDLSVQDTDSDLSDVVLSDEQNQIVELCKRQISFLQGGTAECPSKRIVVFGKAGSGKSTVIKAIRSLVSTAFGRSSVEVAAPTGVAAVNVSGKTLHSLLRISPNLPFAPLQGDPHSRFQEKLKDLKFLVIDEVSMIGATLFSHIEQRCRESRLSTDSNRDDDFGGLFVFLFGDINQLPPVKDAALCSSVFTSDVRKRGKLIFERFQECVRLRQCHRQGGDDSSDFRVILDHISHGSISDYDYNLLMSRRKEVLSIEELKTFENAIRLLPKITAVNEENNKWLRNSRQPVARIVSVNLPNVKDDDVCGLLHVLNIMVGCRVMLKYNLSVDHKLVNGSLGTVKAIVYDQGVRPPALPLYVLVKFDDYQGPYFTDGLVPIVPITVTWYKDGRKYSRTQLPLNLAYALTIHKSQGLTLDKVIVDIGPNEPPSSVGISYVALSRVRRLADLVIEKAFPKDRILKISKMKGYKDRESFLTAKFGSNEY